jgi:peptide/nickel transport system permease protein
MLWLVATLNFAIFSAQTGDPVRYLLNWKMDAETKEAIKRSYGWYDPLPVKYAKYLGNMFTFGIIPPYFGWSIQSNTYISQDMSWRLVITVILLGSALIGRIIVGIPIGVFAASKRGTKLDVGVVGSALITYGVPTFFIELLAILFFGKFLRDQHGIKIFATSWGTPLIAGGVKSLEWWGGCLVQLALPIICLVVASLGYWVLFTRNMLIDALTSDYVLTARAKGISERTVLYRHAFRSILPPISTMITLSIPGVVTGAILTETIFGIEGIGKWYIRALDQTVADYGVAQAVLFIFATLVILCNFIADILYGILDPRIRVGMRR